MIRPVLLPVLDHEKIRTREASETRPNQLTADDSPGAGAGAGAVSVVETADITNRGLPRTAMIRLVWCWCWCCLSGGNCKCSVAARVPLLSLSGVVVVVPVLVLVAVVAV